MRFSSVCRYALCLTLFFGNASSAVAALKVGDIVLFPSVATGGRMYRHNSLVKRVGLVLAVNDEKVTLQEINYPSRQGIPVWRDGAPYEGTDSFPVSSPELVEQVEEVTDEASTVLRRGSRRRIRVGVRTVEGYVLYAFKDKESSFVAVTDPAGWALYQQYGEEAYTHGFVRLSVAELSRADHP